MTTPLTASDSASGAGAAPLVRIPSVTVSQLIGSAPPKPLCTGELRVLPGPAAAPAPSGASAGEAAQGGSLKDVLLLLQVGEQHTFTLRRGTTMGTHEGHEEWYTFDLDLDLDLGGDAAPESGDAPAPAARTWIRLVLPPLSASASSSDPSSLLALRDRFEDLLISRGLLLDGVRAAGDELGQSAAQGGRATAKSWREAAEEYRATVDPSGGLVSTGTGNGGAGTGAPTGTGGFSQWSHRVADGAAGGSATIAHYTGQASAAVGGLASSAGSALGGVYARARESLVGSAEDGEEDKEYASMGTGEKRDTRVLPGTRDAMYAAFEGAREGASSLYSTTTSEAPLLASHAGGPDAGKLTSQAGQTAGNVAQAGVDVVLGTSTVAHGVQAAKGAVGEASAAQGTETGKGEEQGGA